MNYEVFLTCFTIFPTYPLRVGIPHSKDAQNYLKKISTQGSSKTEIP